MDIGVYDVGPTHRDTDIFRTTCRLYILCHSVIAWKLSECVVKTTVFLKKKNNN